MRSKGKKGLIGLKKQFKIADSDNSGMIELGEFKQAIFNFKIKGISEEHAERLFAAFDVDGSGAIAFDEVMLALCGPFPANRVRLVKEAFQKLDTNGNGVLEASEVKQKFDPSRHPDVKAGVSTVEEARLNFFDMFSTFHSAAKGFSGETAVTEQDFVEYHHYLNWHFERDAEFRNFVIGVWNMDLNAIKGPDFAGTHTDTYGKNSREQWKYENHKSVFGTKDPQFLQHPVPEKEPVLKTPKDEMPVAGARGWDRNNPMGAQDFAPGRRRPNTGAQQQQQKSYPTNEELLTRVRQRITSRGARGIIGIAKSFRIMDDNHSETLDKKEFAKALKDYRISSDLLEHQAIFEIFDTDGNGEISYNEFLRSIVGEMNENRKSYVLKAFNKLDRDGSGVVDINDLRGTFNAKKHPDVLAGKMTEDDVIYEFLDTFEQHFALKHGQKNRNRSVT